MTPDEWLDVCALWARIWPRHPLPPESVEPWYDLLADLDGDAVLRGLKVWAADPDRIWPPVSPGQLRGSIMVRDDWPSALAELTRLVRRHGRWDRPELDGPIATVVESFGGWASTCRAWDPTDPTTRAQFRDAWQTIGTRQAREQTRLALGGILPELTEWDG